MGELLLDVQILEMVKGSDPTVYIDSESDDGTLVTCLVKSNMAQPVFSDLVTFFEASTIYTDKCLTQMRASYVQ